MLKAYSYIETEILDFNILDKDISDSERRIIADFVLNNPTPKLDEPCIVCGGLTEEFAAVKGVYYRICSCCYSVFAPVDETIMARYRTYSPLIDFRNSERFQSSAAEKREGIWSDMIFWLEYRIARYLGKNSDVDIIDVNNRYRALARRIKEAGFCGSYNAGHDADVVLFFDQLRGETKPVCRLRELGEMLRDDGILVMSTSVGSGFDVLTLKENSDSVSPYESVFLPSLEGLSILFEKSGFEILEVTTPGTLDVEHVLKNKEGVNPDDWFVNYLIRKSDEATLAEFQRFLQKSGMSSHARVIARKRCVQ